MTTAMKNSTTTESTGKPEHTKPFFKVFQKKEKSIVVNKKSLKNLQKQLDKLRPMREKLLTLLSGVEGFEGIVLGTKLKLIVWEEKHQAFLEEIIPKKYKRYIEYFLLRHSAAPKKSGSKKLKNIM